MFDAVEAASDRWKATKVAERDARAGLAEAVREARNQGASLSDLADVLGISRERVRQMTGDPDDRRDIRATIEVDCEKCGAAAGEVCEGRTRVSFHAERHDRRHAVQVGDAIPTPAEIDVMAESLLK